VETRPELATLFTVTDPKALGLCVDCGHLAYGGADPVEVVEAYGSRVWYVHLKDVDPAILALSQQDGLGFLGALRSYVFCPLGTGGVDLRRFMDALCRAHYSGWMIIEQDTSPLAPLQTARLNRQYLREAFGL
jgi:inosose dehydratase